MAKLEATKLKTMSEGLHGDGGGLYLRVTDTGARSWVFRWQRNGQRHAKGLGGLGDVGLKEARAKAARQRSELEAGREPFVAERAAKPAVTTFREAAEAYVAEHEKGWKNPKHRQQWRSTLEAYVYPFIGDMPVPEVDTESVLRVLKPIWQDKPETASRVRMRIEAVLSAAKSLKQRTGDNPAAWKGHLENLLARRSKARTVKHHPALAYDKAPEFMRELRARDDVSARMLEYVILTAARTGEVVGMTWAEVDTEKAMWIVPGARMKSGREHRVALSPAALAILANRQRLGKFVFQRVGKPFSTAAMHELLKRMNVKATVHGFRSTFSDWAAETTNYPRAVVETALAHVNKDKTEAAYQRRDLLEKRRQLMSAWAEYLQTAPLISAERSTTIAVPTNLTRTA